MKLPEMKWSIVLVAFGLASAMLFAGYWMWQRSAVLAPLQEQLTTVSGVENVKISREQSGICVRLSIRNDADFAAVGEQVDQLLENSLPGQQVDIIWLDARSDALSSVRAAIDLSLKEAQRRHEFVVMSNRIAQIAQEANVEYRVGVGERAIYLELRAGDNVLYDVLPVIPAGGEGR